MSTVNAYQGRSSRQHHPSAALQGLLRLSGNVEAVGKPKNKLKLLLG